VGDHAKRVFPDRRIHRRRVERQQIAEHVILRPQLLVHGIRKIRVRRHEQAQAGGIGDVKPLEQQLFRDGKDRRVRPNRQRERDRGDERETGVLA
jgi:hypothetical protein